VGKCKSVAYGRRIDFSNIYKISDNVIEQVEQIKDLGAYQMLIIIRRNFIYLTQDSFMALYKALVRSHLGRNRFVQTGFRFYPETGFGLVVQIKWTV